MDRMTSWPGKGSPLSEARGVSRFPESIVAVVLVAAGCGRGDASGPWAAALDLAGGPLPFSLQIDSVEGNTSASGGRICSGSSCQNLSRIRVHGDSLMMDIGDYAASIAAVARGDSLLGEYRNVGNRGPRVIPFRAARGSWEVPREVPRGLAGRWVATYVTESGRTSSRVFVLEDTGRGLEGTIISNTGDYGRFWGWSDGATFSLGHFDGSFVYLLTGALEGDTLRGIFHAGARTQTRWTAVRSTGDEPLRDPAELTTMAAAEPFRFAFPDVDGHLVTSDDARFRGKVVLVDVFGTWCPTCHDAAPALVRFYRKYHDRGLEIVGLAYEVTGDSTIDNAQIRRYRDKFGIEFPLLLAGINVTEATAATLPQLQGFTAYPTSIFIGRDGMVRRIHAGFYGPATGIQHDHLVREFSRLIEELLAEPA